jgi:arylsulfatase
MNGATKDRPNVLLVVSDQERSREWLPADVRLPWREHLRATGLELTNHWAHSSPCSPSRATMMTGQYVPQHGVPDNVILPQHAELDLDAPTIGRVLRGAGYRSSYIGKWHLSYGSTPKMDAYGYSDWDGDDRLFMGWAGTGVHFDPVIADNAAHWLRENGGTLDQPWFLTVALVNPHDVMWFPADQPAYQEQHPEEIRMIRDFLAAAAWKDGDPLPAFTGEYDEVVDGLPPNFDDDLHAKPEAQRMWRWDQQHAIWGHIDPTDTQSWRRQLDYYVQLHQLSDRSLGTVLTALDESGAADDTVVIFTSDHGDMCGSHGLRSKGPFVYNEIMKVPLYVRAPGVTPAGASTSALVSHVDLAPTIAALAGVHDHPDLKGVDLTPVLADPDQSVRDYVLFALDSAHTRNIQRTRYSIRGMFDGRYKYARYYGVGGGIPNDGPDGSTKLFDVGADFDDHDHELYDLQEDPHELVNLAPDRGRREELRQRFAQLRSIEAVDFA